MTKDRNCTEYGLDGRWSARIPPFISEQTRFVVKHEIVSHGKEALVLLAVLTLGDS